MNDKHYTLQRLSGLDDSSYGVLFDNDTKQQIAFVIEDEKRDIKVKGETRVPSGTYGIKKREVLSPLTKKYRNKFEYFDYHLELQDVSGFENIYIHIGNFERNTDGCLLVNNGVRLQNGDWVGIDSTSCYEEVYKKISKDLESGKVFITVFDEDRIFLPF